MVRTRLVFAKTVTIYIGQDFDPACAVADLPTAYMHATPPCSFNDVTCYLLFSSSKI